MLPQLRQPMLLFLNDGAMIDRITKMAGRRLLTIAIMLLTVLFVTNVMSQAILKELVGSYKIAISELRVLMLPPLLLSRLKRRSWSPLRTLPNILSIRPL